jgi:general secretion pathway protein D
VIDARIFEVDLTDSLSFGISGSLQAAASGQQLTTGALDAASGALSASTFAFVGNSREILLALNALRTKTKVRVLEAPSVLALDGTMARIVVGAEVPYPAGTFATGISAVQTSVNYRDTGISLIVVPRISASGSVTLDVAQEVSAPGAVVANLGPSFSKTSVATTLSVKDGQTVAIAGLIRNSETVGRAGVPFLQDIPLIGHLFGQTTKSNNRTELLILLTPHVIRTTERFQEMTQELKDSLHNVRKMVDKYNKNEVETLEDARKERSKQEGKKPEENLKPEEKRPVNPPEKPEQTKPEKPAPPPNPTPTPPAPVPPDSTSRPPDKPDPGGHR